MIFIIYQLETIAYSWHILLLQYLLWLSLFINFSSANWKLKEVFARPLVFISYSTEINLTCAAYCRGSATSHAAFEVFTGVTMKNAVFLGVAPCKSCENWRFRGTCRLHLQGRKNTRVRNNVCSWLVSQQSRCLPPLVQWLRLALSKGPTEYVSHSPLLKTGTDPVC
jgi:hypothetical protein